MKKLFSLLLFLSFLSSASAQKDFRNGFVINNKDTLNGLIDYRGDKRNALFCIFKTDPKAAPHKFAPNQVKGYGFENGKQFESHLVPIGTGKNKVFLNVLVKGPASLYTYRDTTSRDRFYLFMGDSLQELTENFRNEKDPQGRLVRISDQKYMKILASNFGSCPAIYDQIKKTRLKGSSLMNTVAAYNRCIDQDKPFYIQPYVKSRFTWGLVAGLNKSDLKLSGYSIWENPEGFKSTIQPQGGLYGNLSLPRINEKLSLQGEVLVTRNKYTASFTQSGNFGRVNQYDLLFDLTYLKLPLQLRYTFPVGKNRPFINMGVMNGYAISVKQESVLKSTLGNNSYTETTPAVGSFRKYNQALTAGIGWQYARRHDKLLLLELRYEAANGFSNATATKTTVNTISFNIGYQL